MLLTVATNALPELQVTVLFVALIGKIVAVSCWVAFTEMLADAGLTVTPVTGTVAGLTVNVQTAVIFPS